MGWGVSTGVSDRDEVDTFGNYAFSTALFYVELPHRMRKIRGLDEGWRAERSNPHPVAEVLLETHCDVWVGSGLMPAGCKVIKPLVTSCGVRVPVSVGISRWVAIARADAGRDVDVPP